VLIQREDAQFEFDTGWGVGREFQVGGVWTMARLYFHSNLEMAINFGTVLDAVNTDNLFCGINPIEDAIITHAELAESGQIHRHTDEPAMHHASGIVREPLDFALHARADGGV
jgi:hypothetical protein